MFALLDCQAALALDPGQVKAALWRCRALKDLGQLQVVIDVDKTAFGLIWRAANSAFRLWSGSHTQDSYWSGVGGQSQTDGRTGRRTDRHRQTVDRNSGRGRRDGQTVEHGAACSVLPRKRCAECSLECVYEHHAAHARPLVCRTPVHCQTDVGRSPANHRPGLGFPRSGGAGWVDALPGLG
jgi:hypothetical protein